VVVETNNDETSENNVDLKRMECRDTQISCIAAKSLAEPPEACRPQESLITRRAQVLGNTWQGH
jgi:hypothetical protein